MLAKISSKGQLVIPKRIRKALNIKPGDQFQVHIIDGQIILTHIGATSPIDQLYGVYADVDLLGELEAEHRRELSRDEKSLRT